MEAEATSVEPSVDEASNEPDETDFLDLLLVVARYKKLVAGVTVGALLLAVAVSLLLPNHYTATARILPPQQNQSLAASLMGQLGSLGPMAAMAQNSLGLKNPNDIYVGMLKSDVVKDALIRRFSLLAIYRDDKLSDARKDLEHYSDIQLGKEGFISISVEDVSPRRAAGLANAYVDELRKTTQRLAVTEAGQRRLFFEQQLQQTKDNLAAAEQALKHTQETTGIIQLNGQAQAIIESVVALRAQIAAKEVQLRSMHVFATEQNPDVAMVEQQIAAMRSQLTALEKRSGGGDGDIQVATRNVPQAGLEYIRKLRDVKYNETIFELLAKQFEAAKLDEAKNGAIIQVLDTAMEPDHKSSPKRALIVLFSTILAFCGSVFYAIFRDTLKRAQEDPHRSEQLRAIRAAVMGK